MNKLLIASSLSFSLCACNSGSSSTNNTPVCPGYAPLFTEELGNTLINTWGTNLAKYSPTGSAGYTDPYVGSAYFTGIQYLPNAVLLPTVSKVTRQGTQEIYNYFPSFISNSPQMTNNPGTPESGGPFVTFASCGTGVISGYYNFSYPDHTPDTNARYTFQFQYLPVQDSVSIVVESGPESGTIIDITQPVGWYIMLQNSSQLPSDIGLPRNLLQD